MTQLTDKHWAVEVPDGAFGFQIIKDQPSILYYDIPASRGECDSGWVQLPPSGSWQYLFSTQGATEEDARKVVKCNQDFVRGAKVQMAFYENYEGRHSSFSSAVVSLQSLLKSKGCDTSKNQAILQNINNE